ncbi:flagellar filament capping protein FliD [Paenibacillus xylanilyticus]|uniref:flagellar filament capping protein FliD n=1 Tax=Paenibacillus xylanilyticus TaxID=248903 RepID=UPI0039A0E0A4
MVTRITGLASGMDIESMVKKLMTAESEPLNKMNATKQLMEWKREGYREISSKLVTLAQTKITDLFSKASSLNAQTTKVSGNTSAITAKAGSTASGVMDINVTNLATAAKTVSTGAPTMKNGSTPSDWGSVKLTDIDGISIDSTTGGTITIAGQPISVTESDTLSSLVSKINANSKTGVSAVYDSASGKISLTSRSTGSAGNSISFSDNSGIFSSLNLTAAFTGGDDAKISVNGLDMTQSSNSFMLNGVELTLNGVTNGTAVHIEAIKDTDKIVENIKGFVDAYNDILGSLNSKLGEERYRSYTPLTSEQKSEMSETEVTQWTEKAKSGMLRNDSLIESTVSQLRTAMMEGVKLSTPITINGETVDKIDMSYLGITTGTWDTKGKLVFNEDKFKAALDENPDIVNQYFGQNFSSSFSNNTYTETDGIFARIKKISTGALASLSSTAGTSKVSSDLTTSFNASSTMGETLRLLNIQISDFQAKLNKKETNYYKKFSAMETAINKYNNISSSLSSYM